MKKRVIVYGIGRTFYDFFYDKEWYQRAIAENNIEIISLADSSTEKIGKEIVLNGKPYIIYAAEDIAELSYDAVLITSNLYYNEIKEELINKKIKEECIFLFGTYIHNLLQRYARYRLSAVLIIKNEARYIEEWIEYHLLKGVEHFYIYDNESNDGLKEILEPYIENEIVSYIKWQGNNWVDVQEGAYEDAIMHYKAVSKYMMFIDVDEFVVTYEKNIPELMDEIGNLYESIPIKGVCEHWGGIGANWRMYGTSYHKQYQEGGVINNFLFRAEDSYSANGHIKSLVNPRVVVRCHAHHMEYIKGYHCTSENGSVIQSHYFFDSLCKKIRINHYWSKSEEEFLEKCKRGWMDDHRKEKLIQIRKKEINTEWNKVYDPVLKDFLE